MKTILLHAPLLLAIYPLLIQACGPRETANLKEAWNSANEPSLLDIEDQAYAARYVYNWQSLPLKGELTSRPWSDDYWPTYRGGISYRWNDHRAPDDESRYAYDVKAVEELSDADLVALSPAEKLDLFIDQDNYPNTMLERYRTNVLKTVPNSVEYEAGFEIPTWEGLCHAWAPAALLFEEPAPITLTSPKGRKVTFGASDVKALLTYLIHRNGTEQGFLGTRCNTKFSEYLAKFNAGEISREEYEAVKNSADCRDLNAGAFHLVLSNQIARLNEGFIADVTRDHEVWNQPVYKYASEVLEDKAGASPGAAPGTVREITLETSMSYAAETPAHWEVASYTFSDSTRIYRYRVELDAKNRIIGGEWLDDERPDFFWKAGRPNYYAEEDFAIKQIYEASIKAKL